jgi:hypothetical protein
MGIGGTLAVLLSACAGTTTPTTGVLTMTEGACTGKPGVVIPKSQVTVLDGGQPVARQAVRAGETYRFVLPPGRYMVADAGAPEEGQRLGVTVIAGRTTHLGLPNVCT